MVGKGVVTSGEFIFETDRGRPEPLGLSSYKGGYNFALFSRNAMKVWIYLYKTCEDKEPVVVLEFDPDHNRIGDIWHMWIKGIGPGWCYTYRVHGPFVPAAGFRFNRHKAVIDPYSCALSGVSEWDFHRAKAYDPGSPLMDLSLSTEDNGPWAAKSVVLNDYPFEWKDDRPLRRPWSQTIIYETHVRGFTIHPSSGVKCPGTYKGLIDKIPYLKSLGITAVELLPVHEFNENELTRINPFTGERLKNYWGYSTVGFFAPKESYSCSGGYGSQVLEFKEMVRELNDAGIEVILDVVFNHTAEGDEFGPMLHMRGLDNTIYYLLADGGRRYRNFSGCGNTVNCNHPVVRDFILACLRYWVIEMHVDGFRFDLASIQGRDMEGNIISNPPVLEHIAEDPILRDVKLIAEAWDLGGAYQVGSFPGRRWSEWNGRYRDDIRRYWRGEPGMVPHLASRLCGSADLYKHMGKQPVNSINFITCHDRFTLNDLVSYERKHNEVDGEDNMDGSDENYSCNYGVEGETSDPGIQAVRTRQIKNMIATLFLSRGVPMILGGDEFRRTQMGNNNAYCQDNEISWYNWDLLDRNREIFNFFRAMIAFRKEHPVLSREQFYEEGDITWFGPSGQTPDWQGGGKALGCIIHDARANGGRLCLLFNAHDRVIQFRLPSGFRRRNMWLSAIDTGAPPPLDIMLTGAAMDGKTDRWLRLGPRSLKVFIERAS